ncbi:DNA polymerase III subunit delta [Aquibacillus koreensis]|uniref:DNA polymerase III subunit delta n=1 Tax=Aquibacillus koreensis TaxID=279446 RepID=A0A9X3WHI1_9BACI|nr:DNA polymerase III subunit delta [Aquibacillus koreensis]MCT2537622.1 DNA polymerase III subunit delta [Aquibacillus koreensis]MDC3419068.1 DNA polymerase III subunit delta [Aquibacillus koreensis]
MNYFETIKALKKKQFSSLYLLQGTESYLIQDVKQHLLTYALAEEDKDTNISIYDLEETSIQEVIADAETYPFFGERKLIFAQNPVFLKAKPDKVAVEHDIDALQSYLLQPVDYSIVIFIAPYEKLDERKKVTKVMKKQCENVSCEPIKEWDLSKWIDNIIKQFHVSIEKPVYDLIAQETGANLLMLRNELEKLATYVGEGGTITYEIATNLLSHNTNTTGLKLVDAVIGKDLNKAIMIYKDLEKLNEDPIALLALLASQFRTIFHVKLLKQKGYSQQQMAQQLKVHPYVVKMSITRVEKFSFDELKEIISIFTETDANVKQGKMEKSLAFELLLYQLVNRNALVKR